MGLPGITDNVKRQPEPTAAYGINHLVFIHTISHIVLINRQPAMSY